MSRPWRLLTHRGRFFVVIGIVVVLVAMAAGQRDVMRLGLLLVALPVIAAILVSRARLRMSCERSIEPAQVPLGSPMKGQHRPRPGWPAGGGHSAAGGLGAPGAGQSATFLGGSGGCALAPGHRVSAARTGTRPLLHWPADGTNG